MKNKNEYEFYNKSQTEQDTIINIAIDLNDDSLDVTKLSNRQTEGIILLSANQKAEDSIHALKKTRIQCGLLNLASTALSAAAVAGFCCHFFQANPLHSIAVGAIASIPFFYSSVKHFDSAYRLKNILKVSPEKRIEYIDNEYSNIDDITVDAAYAIFSALDVLEEDAVQRIAAGEEFNSDTATEEEKANEQAKHENLINEYAAFAGYCDYITDAVINGAPKPSENSDYPEM